MTREERIKKLWLRGRDYPVRVRFCGGQFIFHRRGSVYGGYKTLKEAVEAAIRVVELENSPVLR